MEVCRLAVPPIPDNVSDQLEVPIMRISEVLAPYYKKAGQFRVLCQKGRAAFEEEKTARGAMEATLVRCANVQKKVEENEVLFDRQIRAQDVNIFAFETQCKRLQRMEQANLDARELEAEHHLLEKEAILYQTDIVKKKWQFMAEEANMWIKLTKEAEDNKEKRMLHLGKTRARLEKLAREFQETKTDRDKAEHEAWENEPKFTGIDFLLEDPVEEVTPSVSDDEDAQPETYGRRQMASFNKFVEYMKRTNNLEHTGE